MGRKTYLYVEALKRYSQEVSQMDLREAYKLAHPVYTGRLEHTFIVLKDTPQGGPDQATTGPNNEPIGGSKRAASPSNHDWSKRRAN